MNQRILCFTWNANKASLCERYYTDTNGQYSGELIRKSFFKIINGGDCYNPMFFEAIKDRIITHSPDIVTIVTEHESVSETYFHSDFLPHNMKPLGYILLIRDKEAEDSLIIQSYALRMSIYIKDNDMLTKAYYADTLITSEKCESIVPIALGLYVQSVVGLIVFIAVQMPNYYDGKDKICFDDIEERYINDDVSYAFLLGDFGETYISGHMIGYNECHNDQWLSIIDDHVIQFRYRDRIFHRTVRLSVKTLQCVDYVTISGKPINDHLAILGIYSI